MALRFLHIFLVISTLIITYQAEGQSKRVPDGAAKYRYFQIPGRVKLEKGDPSGAVVNLINNDTKQIEKTVTIPSSGKFDLDLSYFKEYKIAISKEGYYNKEINISTVIPRDVWEKDSIFPPFYIVITLYKKVEGTRLSFEGKPIGKVSYSPNGTLDNFDSNVFIEDKAIQDEISTALKNIDDKEFNQKMAEALEFEKKADLTTAYKLYTEALKIKSSDKFVKEKLKELASDIKSLDSESKMQAEFDRLIALGDANVNSLKYNDAIQYFKGALKVKPNDQVAVARLANAEKQLALLGEKSKIDAEFNRLITAGDVNVNQSKYADAISRFKEALNIKPGDSIAMARITDAEKLLANESTEKAKKEAEFNRLITLGDDKVNQSKYAEAIAHFKEALTIKPADSIALARIARAEKLLANQNNEKSKIETEFNRIVALGDENVKGLKYADAIKNFQEALVLKPSDSVALSKLAAAQQLLAKADSERLKKELEFNRLIASGNENVNKVKYEEAIRNYTDALNIKPEDEAAKVKLAAAERLLANLLASNAKTEEEFNRMVLKGDDNVTVKNYTEAINNYKSALAIKPNNQEVVVKLSNATHLLALENEAKNKKDQEFDRLLALGDANVNTKKYADALTSFKSALSLKSNEVVIAKIANVERLIQQAELDRAKSETEKQALAMKAQKYKEAIDKADQYFASKNYTDSKQYYQQALVVDQTATYPADRILEIGKIIAAQLQADALAREQESAKAKLYNDALRMADEGYRAKNWNLALTNYTKASEIRPNEAYPKTKIQEIKGFMSQESTNAQMYNDAMTRGGTYYSAKQYPEAISAYREAQKVRPFEILPPEKIKEIQLILDGLTAKASVDQKMVIDNKLSVDEKLFQEKLKIADENFKKSQWSVARFYYSEALKIKLGDNYSLDKVDACDKMIDSGITAEKMQDYKNKIAKGDDEMKAKNYSSARFYYRSASEILKWEIYPQQQLKEIDRIFADKLTESDQKLFKENLGKADDAFNRKEYPVARFYYNKAIEISQNNYVSSRLKDIESIVNGSESRKVNAAYEDFIKKGDDAIKQNNISIARFYFLKANTLKPDESYPKEELKKIDAGAGKL